MTAPIEEAGPAIPGLEYVRPLGAGGYSNVYLYQQQMPRRLVAVKVLKAHGLSEAVTRQFAAEANAMAALADHPSIVAVFAADVTADGRPYLVMSFYAKDNLFVRASRERFAVSEVLKIGIQISSAVQTAHDAGLLHRDIKPANILTNQYDAVGLTDFGIAAQIAAAEDDDDTGVSVPWTAPEVLLATSPASVQSDVYSLGATLWHLLVGRSPFETPGGANDQLALMQRARTAPVPPTGRGDVPAAFERLLGQAMSKDPTARPPSALDFARSLQSIEQELRLGRTDIIVLSEEAAPAAPPVNLRTDDDATRLRAPVVVDAQPPAAPTPIRPPIEVSTPIAAAPPSAPTSAPNATVGQRPVAAAEAAAPTTASETVRRPVQPEDSPTAEAVSSGEPRRARTAYTALAVGVVLLVVVAVGVFVVSSGSDDSRASSGAHTARTGAPDEIGPPGSATVNAKRVDANTADFSWTYANRAESDTYLWQYPDGSRNGSVSVPDLQLPVPSGTRACVQVKVVRADGSNPQLSWSDPGCVS